MQYRTVILFLIIITCWMGLSAQSGSIVVHKDKKIDQLMDLYSDHENAKEEAPGYRIQVMAGTSSDKAYKAQANFNYAYPQYNSYLEYTSPYFKIRVGDFTDRLSAHRFLHQVKTKYPGSFIVEEMVKLK